MNSEVNENLEEILNVFADKDSVFNQCRMRDGDRLYSICYLLYKVYYIITQ
jgi:hypothetical protein